MACQWLTTPEEDRKEEAVDHNGDTGDDDDMGDHNNRDHRNTLDSRDDHTRARDIRDHHARDDVAREE